MKTKKQSRIRIKTLDETKSRPFLAVNNVISTVKKKKSINKKHIKSKHGFLQNITNSKIELAMYSAAISLTIGLALLAVWHYFGIGTSLMMMLIIGLGAALFYNWRKQHAISNAFAMERKKLSSNYDRLVRETARNRQDFASLKQDLIETGQTAQRIKQIRDIGANEDVSVRMLDTLVEKLSYLGVEALEDKKEFVHTPLADIIGKQTNSNLSRSSKDKQFTHIDRFDDWTDKKILDHVSNAIKQNDIDLFIQPIVNLPQRKRHFYEMYSRIRVDSDAYLPAYRYIDLASKHNMLAEIDNILLLRGLQLIQAADAGNLNRSFFCNITPLTLNDQKFMGDLLEFLTQYRILAPRLIFELAQSDVMMIDENVSRILDGLSRLGCRFSMDCVTTIDFDFSSIEACHIRFIKIGSKLLNRKLNEKNGFTQLRLLKDNLDYNGIDLIVEKIETEEQVLKLLDIDINYGQGYLFGEPRRWAIKE